MIWLTPKMEGFYENRNGQFACLSFLDHRSYRLWAPKRKAQDGVLGGWAMNYQPVIAHFGSSSGPQSQPVPRYASAWA